jgi:hypothetical protein
LCPAFSEGACDVPWITYLSIGKFGSLFVNQLEQIEMLFKSMEDFCYVNVSNSWNVFLQAIVRSAIGGDVLTDCLLRTLEGKGIEVSVQYCTHFQTIGSPEAAI